MQMICRSSIVIAIFATLLPLPSARAQSSMDGLLRDIQELKSKREKDMTAGMQLLLTRLETAAQNGDEARSLLKECGYLAADENDPARPKRKHAPANLAEKHEMEAQASNSDSIEIGLTKHCSLVWAALSLSSRTEKERPKFEQDWLATMLADYPNYRSQDIAKIKAMESPITKHFGIGYLVETSDLGKGNLRSIPGFYKRLVLQPLRNPLKAEALASWDVFIGLKQTDGGDNPDSQLVEIPEYQFYKSQDAFILAPSESAISAQVQLLKTYSEHPKFNTFIGIIENNVKALRSGTKPEAVPEPPSTPAP
jgi:hypothetical protein